MQSYKDYLAVNDLIHCHKFIRIHVWLVFILYMTFRFSITVSAIVFA
jgi:hypothetical protein